MPFATAPRTITAAVLSAPPRIKLTTAQRLVCTSAASWLGVRLIGTPGAFGHGTSNSGGEMQITLVTTMRNEGPHLLEWIAHHRAAGVSEFVIFTNDCEDGTDALLDILDVTHIRLQPSDKSPQWEALKQAWDLEVVQKSDWVLCIDSDEFINIANGIDGLPDLIDRCAADAIMLPWRLFGNSGLTHFSDDLTTRRFLRAAPEDMIYPPIGSYFKTLFRRDGPFRALGVHRPKQKNADNQPTPRWVDGSGLPIEGPLPGNDRQIMHWGQPIARDLVQLNHYSVRSCAESMIKRARGLPNHRTKQVDLTYWVERNFNTVEDNSIQNMEARTQMEITILKHIPDVAEAADAAINWHRNKLAELLLNPVELKLYGRLMLASGSVPPSEKTAIELIKHYQAIDANR